MRRFGSRQVRESGTVGGNIANGSPIGDLAPALIALGAQVELQHGGATRALPLEDFFLAYGKQDRGAGRICQRASSRRGSAANEAYRAFKVTKRFDEDISAVMGAFRFTLDGRRIAGARVAYGGMAATPKRAANAEARARRRAPRRSRGLVGGGARRDRRATSRRSTDMRATAAYRAEVAANLLKKALIEIAGGARADPHRRAPCRALESPPFPSYALRERDRGRPQAASRTIPRACTCSGAAAYIDDIREPQGTLHVAVGMADKARGNAARPRSRRGARRRPASSRC